MKKKITEEKIEELFDRQLDYFESCIDKIFNHFQTYGYTYAISSNPTREDFQDTIKGLMRTSLEYYLASSGKITVKWDSEVEKFEVSIDL